MSSRCSYLLDGPIHLFWEQGSGLPHIEVGGREIALPEEWHSPLKAYYWSDAYNEDLNKLAGSISDAA